MDSTELFYEIVNLMNEELGIDFSNYQYNYLKKQITKRIVDTGAENLEKYKDLFSTNKDEHFRLFNYFSNTTSHFFRNPLIFELLYKHLIPMLIFPINQEEPKSLRIWSAGCANGEEPYSMAIILNEIEKKQKLNSKHQIIATDINLTSIEKAQNAIYQSDSIRNVKYSYLQNYFVEEYKQFYLKEEIKQKVDFQFSDLIKSNNSNFPEGMFDIILCRNVLIYLTGSTQLTIFNKLYNSLKKGGYLVLGISEQPPASLAKLYAQVTEFSQIYKKL